MLQRLHQFRRWAGVDRAVFFSNAGQLLRLVTGPITMVLVLRYLTPEIQGYFYAFAGVVATQVFLEMGFSQNILQFASHEFAKLRLTSAEKLEGDPVALSRLISLGRLAFVYYAVAAIIFFIAVGVGGHIFFAHSEQNGVAWRGAWWLVAAAAAGSLAINPAWALLDGCNQIAITAKFRFWSALACFAANALALIFGAGIYVTAVGALCGLFVAASYLLFRWRKFFMCFLTRPLQGHVSWRREIWPFQWRIAVSWMSGYFVFDIVNPIAFHYCGAIEAGRLGMSLQFTRMIYNVAMTWSYTKMPRYGMLIAARAWTELDSLWRRSTIQSFIFCLLALTGFSLAVPLAGHFFPKILLRVAPAGVNLWLGCAWLVQILIACMSLELRGHKREPYMRLSVANAILTMAFILPLVRVWGIYGEAMGYALAICAVLPPAWKIYHAKRHEFRRMADAPTINPASPLEAGSSSGTFA